YAMSGMSTSLNLMASKLGTYRGLSANISGDGFAGMHFSAVASTTQNYQKWLTYVRSSSDKLDKPGYDQLSRPTSDNPPAYYALTDSGLYNEIINKYAEPVFKAEN